MVAEWIPCLMLTFCAFTLQVAGFFVRRVVLKIREYSYGRSFEEFFDVCLVYTLPLALLAFS